MGHFSSSTQRCNQFLEKIKCCSSLHFARKFQLLPLALTTFMVFSYDNYYGRHLLQKKKARLHLSFGAFLSFGEFIKGCIWCSKCEFLQLFLDHFKMEKLTISVIFYWGERGNLYKNWLISSSLMTFKGQIISKCSFVILQFSQKTDKRIRRRSRNEFVRSFFGRIRGDQKSSNLSDL